MNLVEDSWRYIMKFKGTLSVISFCLWTSLNRCKTNDSKIHPIPWKVWNQERWCVVILFFELWIPTKFTFASSAFNMMDKKESRLIQQSVLAKQRSFKCNPTSSLRVIAISSARKSNSKIQALDIALWDWTNSQCGCWLSEFLAQ